jgi:hypothetical protein
MQMRSPTGCRAAWIRPDRHRLAVRDRHDTQEVGLGCSLTTTDTGAQ